MPVVLPPQARAIDPTRLTVGLAESLCLRATIKPVTFPFKLWASYMLTLQLKKLTSGGGSSSKHVLKNGAAQQQRQRK